MWFTIVESVAKILHWVTGFFVHPESGGCCKGMPHVSKYDLKKEE